MVGLTQMLANGWPLALARFFLGMLAGGLTATTTAGIIAGVLVLGIAIGNDDSTTTSTTTLRSRMPFTSTPKSNRR